MQNKPLILFQLVIFVCMSPYLHSQISTTFSYTGAMQIYTVPAGISLLGVDASGAQGGGSGYGGPGGNGGRVTCTISVVPGSTLAIFVGQMPATLAGGYNGGGNGVAGLGASAGGGATDIRIGGVGLSDRIVVAGGGGGSGQGGAGIGGGLVGGGGSTTGLGIFATGGSQSAGGIGGLYNNGTCAPGAAAGNGSLGLGGNGVSGINGCSSSGGSGGGGGYYGGGGMQVNGAGGGSNYADASATNVAHIMGYRAGNGELTLVALYGATATQTNVSCNGGSNGSIIVSPTAGFVTGPFTYSWLPSGSTSSVLTGLSGGTYTCLVSASGNTAKLIVNITQPAVLTSVSSQTNVSCFGGSNGAALLNLSGGIAPYSYTWSPSGGNAAMATGFNAGTYTVAATDAPGCSVIQQVITITQPSTFAIAASASSPTVCSGNTLTLNGGGAISYTWSGGVLNGTPFAPFATSTYSVSGTNSLGCLSSNTAVLTVTVLSSPVITLNNGTICLGQAYNMIIGGVNTYTFLNGGIIVSPTISSTYSVIGTNSLGCISSNTAMGNVIVYSLPTITVNSGTVCSGSSFTLNASGANTYTFSGGSNVISPTGNASYSVTGTSTLGCVSAFPAISNVTVISLPAISVNSGSICQGQSFTITPSGASTYTFAGGSSVVTPTGTTTYSVAGTSSSGCVSSNAALSIVIVNPLPLLTVNSASICAGQTFTIIPGGASTYTLSTGSTIITPSVNVNYSLTGTSSQGCIGSNTATGAVSVYAIPFVTVNGSGTICAGESYTITPGGANSYSYSGGNSIVSPLVNSNYTVTGYNAISCISSNSPVVNVQIKVVPTLTLSGPNAVCLGSSITELASTSAISYTWHTGSTGNLVVLSPTVNTVCSITVTGSSGCTNMASKLITVNPLPVVSASSNNDTLCSGDGLILNGSGAVTYSWSSNVTNNVVFYPTASSSYTVIGTDANGCSNTATFYTFVKPVPLVTAISTSSLICPFETTTLVATGALYYNWNNGSNGTTTIINPSVTSTYTVTGFASNGCKNKTVITQSVSECIGLNQLDKDTKITFKVYPNPNAGDFTISSDISMQLSIINEVGQQVKTIWLTETPNRIASITNLPNGIYFIVGTNNSQVISRKIMVNK